MVRDTIGPPVHTVALQEFVAPVDTAHGAVATGLLHLPAARMEHKLKLSQIDNAGHLESRYGELLREHMKQ